MELSLPFSFPLTVIYCWLQDRFSSIVRPKYFVLLILLILSLSISKLPISEILLSYLSLPMNMYSHFATFRLSLFCRSQSMIPSSSLFK